MKKAIQALLRRIFGPLFFGLILAALTTACAVSATLRYPWDKQPERHEVLPVQSPKSLPTPPPAATPTPALVITLVFVACDGNINLFGSPTQIQGGIPSASPSPSPSPFPSPAPTADPCLIKAVRVSFKGGSDSQLPFVPLGQTHQLDATPMNDSGVISDGCNAVREPVWAVLTPLSCQIIGGGYNPFLRGLRVGACTVTATVSNVVSAPFSVEVR